jgi:hypothetical protein
MPSYLETASKRRHQKACSASSLSVSTKFAFVFEDAPAGATCGGSEHVMESGWLPILGQQRV